MKSLARLHVWWPNLDKDIATVVQKCDNCQKSRNKPQQAPLHPWDWPKMPWQRVHIDFAGPFMGKMFLIVVDSHSKWFEVEIMPSITSAATIEKLRDMFSRQTDQKARHDKVSKEREFTLGEQVLVQNFRGEPKWLGGVITEQTGPVSYKVLVGDQLWKRHVDQMHQKREDSLNGTTEVSVTPSNDAIAQDVVDIQPVTPPQIETAENATPEPSEIISSESSSNAATHATAMAQSQPQPRYPTRQRKAPQRLGFDTK
ncbi:hypothetical protein ACROYT_G016843 [Oculina patagonica]